MAVRPAVPTFRNWDPVSLDAREARARGNEEEKDCTSHVMTQKRIFPVSAVHPLGRAPAR